MKKWIAPLIVGVILLIIGVFVAMQPTTLAWKNMRDISEQPGGFDFTLNDGSVVDAHYKSYELGDTIMVSGKITNKSWVFFPVVKDRGYRYNYILDGITEEPITSKTDIGEVGDEVHLNIELTAFTDGFFIYQLWSAESKANPSPVLWYGIGLILLVLGTSLMVAGAWKIKGSKREEAQVQPSDQLSEQPLETRQYEQIPEQQQQVSEPFAEEPVLTQLVQYPCQICRQPLMYVHQYQRWYCYNCQRYV